MVRSVERRAGARKIRKKRRAKSRTRASARRSFTSRAR